MSGSSPPWHDPGWVVSCWTKMILERTGYASCPFWYFIHRGCKQDHKLGQSEGPLLCCPVSGGDTVQEQELSPCTPSQPGLLEPMQPTYTMSTLTLDTLGMSQEESSSIRTALSKHLARKLRPFQILPSCLACSNGPTKTKSRRSRRIYSKQEQVWG